MNGTICRRLSMSDLFARSAKRLSFSSPRIGLETQIAMGAG
jgi:hypothetical protein